MLRLTRLRLTDFRSWPALEAPLDAPIVAIAGENGAGKTNLLEAISLLGPGRGLRGARMGELGRRTEGGQRPWAAAGRFTTPHGTFDIGTGSDPEGTSDRRVFRLDGLPVRTQADLADRIAVVWLTPQMDRLFQEGASGRRRFLDRLAWALEPTHAREVAAHDNAMSQRNRLLAGGRADPAWLAGLEDAMARHAVAATAARRSLATKLNRVMATGSATGAFPAARMDLLCPIATALADQPALAVEDALRAALAADRRRDAAAGGAARGAHRADMALTHLPKNQPAEMCSTGEQKALLISTVLAHAALIAEARGFAPLLLLDEVAAHLDSTRREALFAALATLPAQSFLTGTDAEVFRPLQGIARRFRATPGKLLPEDETGSH
ncbi:DNA replication/repair protein RecF [Neoroseomonas lacus]|uniref:DNA replication and repair protein RecF n=1 Tax=Neoroseomonas lacus TaxID=287609 RepID=A0A917NUC3_9PROT|nr:DNA replication/repair protein RecF [Neoroseomonas lacus]GGJ26014.1 DNA replication and repair protein RecF [Neoroseomonas lacus]